MDKSIKCANCIKTDNYKIEPTLYEQFEVNRGLRRKNGTGVLVGLTRIGDVDGYVMVDGQKTPAPGKLFYRGMNVEDLIQSCMSEGRYGFEEVIYLLLMGELPTREKLKEFQDEMRTYQNIPDKFTETVYAHGHLHNPMNYLAQCVLTLYNYDKTPDSTDLDCVLVHCLGLIARFPAIVACSLFEGRVINEPDPNLSVAENFLRMIRRDGKFTKTEALIMDTSLILHAEHGGGNNSTFTTRVVASTGTDTFSAISSAICSLKGPKHGGANSKVLTMMKEIKENVKDWANREEVYQYLAKIIRKEAGDGSGLIYGMGHAVYTVSDPRAVILTKQARQLAKEKGREKELNLYLLIEELSPIVFADIKGNGKDICANVDFYTGFIYDMLGIPSTLCTPIFAMSRMVGWCAHRIDELINGGRIMRPAFRDIGERVQYIPMASRK
jgi:citrate synthase